MTHLVEVTCLEVPFTVSLGGVTRGQAAQLADAWEWCGGRLVDEVQPGQTLVRAELAATSAASGSASASSSVTTTATAPDDRAELVAETLRELEDRLSGLLTRRAIDTRRNDLVMLHAGAVADPRTGNVIAFVGPSGRGKTTASIALGRAFGYVTDETLGVNDDLSVLAYGKPLSVKQPAPERWKNQVSPSGLGLLQPPAGRLTLVGVVMLDRRAAIDGEELPGIRSIGLAEAIDELVPQVSYLAERGYPLQRLRAMLDRCGGLRQVSYVEAESLVGVFAELFAAAEAASAAGAAAEAAGGAPNLPPEVLHAVFDDVVRDGDSLIVLNGSVVRVLAGIAPTLVENAVTGSTLDELEQAVIAVHGAPPAGSPGDLVAQAVEELVAAGILRTAGLS